MPQIKVTYIDSMGSDLSVVSAARVSFGKESKELSGKDEKLIKYLADHEHYSPFGHCFASFRVKAPIFVARQLVKHKFLRWNEVSRRYVDYRPEFYTPKVWRGRPKDKKQGSSGIVTNLEEWYPCCPEEVRKTPIKSIVASLYDDLLVAYDDLIEADMAPEMARMVLPLSTMTEWYWSGSLDAFADMCNLRNKPDAQEESRLVGEKIGSIMSVFFPISWEALTTKGERV